MAMSTASAADAAAIGPPAGALLGGYLLLSASWWLVAAHCAHRRGRSSAPRGGRLAWATRLVAVEPLTGAISYVVMAAGMGAVLLAAQ
jgi:hypothetical protein